MKAVRLGELLEPREPPYALPRLVYQKSDHNEEIDSESKNLRANDGLADALDSGITAAKLSAPPERARRTDASCAGRLGSSELKSFGHQNLVATGAAGTHMGAQFRRTGCRPLTTPEQVSNFFFTGTGIQHHGCLHSGCLFGGEFCWRSEEHTSE